MLQFLSIICSYQSDLFPLFHRAVNNELLDTYQLKSLDGLVEGGLEDIAIVRNGEDEKKRSGRKKKCRSSGKEKRGKLFLTLAELLDSSDGKNSSKVTATNLPVYHNDNFSLRQPYDRVIRCLGFRFNFSIFDGYVNDHFKVACLCIM